MPTELKNSLLTALLALVFGFLGAAIWSYAGLADNRTKSYLIDNPSILQDVAEALAEEQARERLADVGDELYRPFPGAIIGNPEGSKTMVEFSDYNCGFCEASLADVQRLVSEDPDLKVVIRELPLLDVSSEEAARMALAAGLQGKYRPFHEALFGMGDTSPEGIEAAARAVGLDLERARADAASDQVSVEIARNVSMARALGFNGTPGFIAGDIPLPGAVGYERLKEALADSEG